MKTTIILLLINFPLKFFVIICIMCACVNHVIQNIYKLIKSILLHDKSK